VAAPTTAPAPTTTVAAPTTTVAPPPPAADDEPNAVTPAAQPNAHPVIEPDDTPVGIPPNETVTIIQP
jgi:hypothetical protein